MVLSDMVRGCVRGFVEELCWLFFVPCEQSAQMCVMLRITSAMTAYCDLPESS